MEKEKPTKSEYEFLNMPDKIRAILGAVNEPVSKQLAIDLSGIDYDGLDDETKAAVHAVFSESGVKVSKDAQLDKYQLGDEERKKLFETVKMESVHKAIADKILENLGLDL